MKVLGSKMIRVALGIQSLSALQCSTAYGRPRSSGLPPNWDAGGSGQLRSRPRLSMDTGTESVTSKKKDDIEDNPSNRWTIGIAVAVPELVRLDLRKQLTNTMDLYANIGPGWPFEITVEMPSDVIKSDQTNTLAAAYTAFDANFDATWGPHLNAGIAWHPLGGAWFVGASGGYRSLGLKGSAQSQLRICTIAEAAKEPPCANDQVALQTRNHLRVEVDARVESVMAAAQTGWAWQAGEHFQILLGLGATRALRTTYKVKVNATIVDVDGTPQEVSGALSELKIKSEQDVAGKSKTELASFAEKTLPTASLGIGYAF